MQLFEKSSSDPSDRRELKSTFVMRLERLVQVRDCFSYDLNPQGLKLLNHSIRATHQDCIDCGAGEDARRIMARRGYDGGAE